MHNVNLFDIYRRNVKDKVIAAAATLAANETRVSVTNGTYTITLPSVADAAGKLYSFLQAGTGTNSVTIDDAGDDPTFVANIVNAQNEKVLLYCDGRAWFALVGQTS